MNFHEFEEILAEARKVRTVPLRKTVGGKTVASGFKLARWKTPKEPAKKKAPPVVGGDTPPKTSTSSLPGETLDTWTKRIGQDVKRPEGASDASWEKFQNQLKRL